MKTKEFISKINEVASAAKALSGTGINIHNLSNTHRSYHHRNSLA